MYRNTFSLLLLLAVVFLGAAPAFAQPPTDNLNGKTIHIYVESDNFNAFFFQNGDLPFKLDSKYNYSITLAGRDIYQQDFFFTSNGTSPAGEHYKWKFGKTGLNEAAEGRYSVADFKGQTEIWIVVDPSGPVTAPPLLLYSAPKVVNILNPWSTTAPKLVYGGTKTRAMTTTPGRCGWFSTLLLDTTLTKGHFQEINNTENYGLAGIGSAADFDFAAQFAAKASSTIWLNTQANSWSAAWPNLDGDCQYLMAATVHDVSKNHVDFEFPSLTGDFLTKGMVETTIGADRKPVSTKIALKAPVTYGTFDSWWKTDTTNTDQYQRNYESCVDIPMSKSSDGLWEYDSYRDSPTDHSFFPVEGTANRFQETVASCYVKPPPDTTNWVTSGTPLRNGNFCMESHATFIYQKGQRFAFRGDDDVWVFINDKLVVDLGGVHTPKSDSVDLDKLNLTAGTTYKWDFFYCDRQPCGSSLRVKTSIYFKQQRALYGIEQPGPTPGSISLEIWKRTGGTGSCASIGTTSDSTKAANLSYQLLDAAGAVVKDLASGTPYYNGGISINTPLVTVDTSKITGGELTPGATYRVVAFEPANQLLKVEIPFKVPVRNFVEMLSPLTYSAPVGTLVKVIAGNVESGLPKAGAVKYTPVIPNGLDVYQDSAKTLKVVAGTELTTDATGFDTLWVSGTTSATTDKTYPLANPAPAKTTLLLTFLVPKNHVEFDAPYVHEVLVGTVVTLPVSNIENGAVVAKAQTYTLKIPAGLKVFADAGMTQPIANLAIITTDDKGLGVIYASADSSGLLDRSYQLEITGAVKSMTLQFNLPPLDIPKVLSAGIYDDDGDGIGDRIKADYDRDITASAAPKQISYKWPASGALVPGPTGAAVANLVTGKGLTYKGKFSEDVVTSGTGVFASTYPARLRDSVQNVTLADHIGPIILTAQMTLGKTQDTLNLTFSEPIGPISAPLAELFGYKRQKDAVVEQVEPLGVFWNADRTSVGVVFSSTAANEPRAGDLVRINDGPGLVSDAQGNTAGPGSRFRSIGGGKRSEVATVTYRKIDPSPALLQEPALSPSLQPANSLVADVVERTGRMGHLIKADLGSYAVKDDFSNIDPGDVTLEYKASYFTNLGAFVNSASQTITCKDPIFGNDCLTNRGYVFVGWNYTAKSGAKVGTGAYVARLNYTVRVAGKVVETGNSDQTWGVVRD
ncbi:MAG: fibro-slime domain-containing protein [Fibrobacteria bacterium]